MTPPRMTIRRTFSSGGFGAGAGPLSLGKPAAAYPGRVATDADLMIAVDRQQTRLAAPLDASATSMTVENPANIGAYNLLSIDSEIVKTTGPPAGNVVPISRGFDGTTPALHLASALVSGFIDAYHHNALVAEVEAIEAALGPNLSGIPAATQTVSSAYDFAPQTPGGNLSVGTNVITLAPVPEGVNGTDKSHYLWIDLGTGAAEAVLITGGTAVSGAASGTLFFNCANAHSGAWRISSATAGIQEAVQILDTAGSGGTVLIPPDNWPIHATITLDVSSISLQGSGRGASILTGDLAVSPVIRVGTGSRGVPFDNSISRLTVTRAAGAIPNNSIGILWLFFNYGYTDSVEYTRHYIAEKLTHTGGSICIGFYSDRCWMWGNVYAHIHVEHAAGVYYTRLYMGGPGEVTIPAGSPDYGVVISHDSNGIKFIDCDWLPTVSDTLPNAMQWGVLFANMAPGTGMFIFNGCNWENIAQGIFTSDATTTGVTWLEVNAGRSGISVAGFVAKFNAATEVKQFFLHNANLSGKIQLTNPIWSKILGCFIGSAMTITGGDILVSGNVFASQPTFTGNFRCLNLGPNSFVFNTAADLDPDLSGAAGNLYVHQSAADTTALFRTPDGKPEGVGMVFAGSTLNPPSDNFFVLNSAGTLNTISLPYPGFAGIIHIALTQAVTFSTGGNIATALSASAGQLVTAAYSKSQSKWYLK